MAASRRSRAISRPQRPRDTKLSQAPTADWPHVRLSHMKDLICRILILSGCFFFLQKHKQLVRGWMHTPAAVETFLKLHVQRHWEVGDHSPYRGRAQTRDLS